MSLVVPAVVDFDAAVVFAAAELSHLLLPLYCSIAVDSNLTLIAFLLFLSAFSAATANLTKAGPFSFDEGPCHVSTDKHNQWCCFHFARVAGMGRTTTTAAKKQWQQPQQQL